MGTKNRISKKRNWEQRVLMASSLRPTNVNKVNASRYGRLTLVRNAAVGSLLPKEVRSKMRRLRGLTFAFALCASASSLFSTGGIIGSGDANIDPDTTIYGKLSLLKKLVDDRNDGASPPVDDTDSLIAAVQAVQGDTSLPSPSTFGIIGSEATVNNDKDIYGKLLSVKRLIDDSDDGASPPVENTSTLTAAITAAIDNLGTDGKSDPNTIGGEADLYGKTAAITQYLHSGSNTVADAIAAIMGAF